MSKWDDPSTIIHLKSSAMLGWFSQSIFHWRTVGTGLGRTGQGVVKKKYPLVMTHIATENGHRNSGFTHWKWWIFPSYVNVYQRVPRFWLATMASTPPLGEVPWWPWRLDSAATNRPARIWCWWYTTFLGRENTGLRWFKTIRNGKFPKQNDDLSRQLIWCFNENKRWSWDDPTLWNPWGHCAIVILLIPGWLSVYIYTIFSRMTICYIYIYYFLKDDYLYIYIYILL